MTSGPDSPPRISEANVSTLKRPLAVLASWQARQRFARIGATFCANDSSLPSAISDFSAAIWRATAWALSSARACRDLAASRSSLASVFSVAAIFSVADLFRRPGGGDRLFGLLGVGGGFLRSLSCLGGFFGRGFGGRFGGCRGCFGFCRRD